MNSTQNKKISQVKETTMIVGVDVGSEKHFFRAFNWRGIKLTRKPVPFSNSMEGFNSFYNTVVELMQKNNLEESMVNIKEFKKAAKSLNVNIQFISDKDELVEYINNKNGDGTECIEDKISDISVFSHGLNINRGIISLGFDYSDEYNKNLNIDVEDIDKISTESFTEDLNSNFYSCNIGTAGEESFAQKWVNKFGGVTTAFSGKTDYEKVPDNSLKVKNARKLTKKIYGISLFGGNPKFPIAGKNAEQVIFICNDLEGNCSGQFN